MMELRVVDLCKSYGGIAVLKNVSFTAGVGLTRITGSSGIGKTTLLRLLLGLERPDSGATNAEAFRWAAVFQEDRLLEHLNAAGNLRFALGAAYDEHAAAALLDELGLGGVGDKRVRDFSGGMKRRLALARALLAPSDALALDEPFTGLDAENRDSAWRCIMQIAREKPVLLVSHEDDSPADTGSLDNGVYLHRTVELEA